MKNLLLITASLALLASIAGGYAYLQHAKDGYREELERERTAWRAEREKLLKQQVRRARPESIPEHVVIETNVVRTVAAGDPPDVLLAHLVDAATARGGDSTRRSRAVIKDLELLVDHGEPALPVLRNFLNDAKDASLAGGENWFRRGWRGDGSRDFLVPPTLRLGLMEVVKQIGGVEAEDILAEALARTAVATEIVWLTGALEDMAPGDHLDLGLQAARDLLTRPVPTGDSRADDANRRLLFELLSRHNDATLVALAQQGLVGADGNLDRIALDYLEDTMGDGYLDVVQQALRDPRMTDLRQQRQLVDETVELLGRDPRAETYVGRLIADASLPLELRSSVISAFDDEGINRRRPDEEDMSVVDMRMRTLEEMLGRVTETELLERMGRAYEELQETRERFEQNEQRRRELEERARNGG